VNARRPQKDLAVLASFAFGIDIKKGVPTRCPICRGKWSTLLILDDLHFACFNPQCALFNPRGWSIRSLIRWLVWQVHPEALF
jgi:hypothetical protein